MPGFNLSPAQLRRIANILETNSDQPGFDFYSALAAMEAEDLGTSADNTGSVKCDLCGDESNSRPGLICGRIEYNDRDEPITSPCQGTYRSTEIS